MTLLSRTSARRRPAVQVQPPRAYLRGSQRPAPGRLPAAGGSGGSPGRLRRRPARLAGQRRGSFLPGSEVQTGVALGLSDSGTPRPRRSPCSDALSEAAVASRLPPISADLAVGASHASWPTGGPATGYGYPVQPPAGLLRADRRLAADSLLGRVGGGLRAPAGTSAIVRHRQPFRCAELAAVIRRGELHDGPGVAGRGPGVRGAASGQLAWEGGADQRAARLSTFPQPRSSTRVQRGGQRIYRNHPQAYTQGVTLAG